MHKQSGVATILAGLLFGCANQPSGPEGTHRPGRQHTRQPAIRLPQQLQRHLLPRLDAGADGAALPRSEPGTRWLRRGQGQRPAGDPQRTLDACTQKWPITDKLQTCELFFVSVRKLQPEQAAAKCRAI